jgi:hypothetical protein
MPRKLTKDEWIEKARAKHGDSYDYSRVAYINSRSPIVIGCARHGWFEQKANNHVAGFGCSSCSSSRKLTTEEWVLRARKTHGDRYDYSRTDYDGDNVAVRIVCPEHGEFEQRPGNHLRGCGCIVCGRRRARSA